MPEIGKIRNGHSLGYKSNNNHIWLACADCGKERWVQYIRGKPRSLRCKTCAMRQENKRRTGSLSPCWKGGRVIVNGYALQWVSPNDFFHSMADFKSYILEHRLVMAKHLNRCLLSWEIVHHKNGIKDDNRLENLELLPTSRQHLPSMRWQQELDKRDKRIAELEQRVTLLEAELVVERQIGRSMA